MPARQGIGVQTSIGLRPHRVRLQHMVSVPDGDGSWTLVPEDLNPPEVSAAIGPASVADLEQLAGGTVISQATHLVRLPYHAGLTTESRIVFPTLTGTRTFNVLGLANPDERNAELVAICSEVVS